MVKIDGEYIVIFAHPHLEKCLWWTNKKRKENRKNCFECKFKIYELFARAHNLERKVQHTIDKLLFQKFHLFTKKNARLLLQAYGYIHFIRHFCQPIRSIYTYIEIVVCFKIGQEQKKFRLYHAKSYSFQLNLIWPECVVWQQKA